MNTKNIPAVVMLTGGFVDCLFAIYQHQTLAEFTKQLLLVLVIFLVIGGGVKLVIDRFFKEEKPEEENEKKGSEAGTAEEPEAKEEPADLEREQEKEQNK